MKQIFSTETHSQAYRITHGIDGALLGGEKGTIRFEGERVMVEWIGTLWPKIQDFERTPLGMWVFGITWLVVVLSIISLSIVITRHPATFFGFLLLVSIFPILKDLRLRRYQFSTAKSSIVSVLRDTRELIIEARGEQGIQQIIFYPESPLDAERIEGLLCGETSGDESVFDITLGLDLPANGLHISYKNGLRSSGASVKLISKLGSVWLEGYRYQEDKKRTLLFTGLILGAYLLVFGSMILGAEIISSGQNWLLGLLIMICGFAGFAVCISSGMKSISAQYHPYQETIEPDGILDMRRFEQKITFLLRCADGQWHRALLAAEKDDADAVWQVLNAPENQQDHVYQLHVPPYQPIDLSGFFGHGTATVDGSAIILTGKRMDTALTGRGVLIVTIIAGIFLAFLADKLLSIYLPDTDLAFHIIIPTITAVGMALLLRMLINMVLPFCFGREVRFMRYDLLECRRIGRQLLLRVMGVDGQEARYSFLVADEDGATDLERQLHA